MTTLTRTKDTITRSGVGLTYASFRVIADGTGRTLAFPVPANVTLMFQQMSLTFDWEVSNSPTTMRIWMFDAEPTPAITLTDNVDPAGIPFAAQVNKLYIPPAVNVFPVGGLSYGEVFYDSAPLLVNCTTGTLGMIFMTTTGTTAPANGKIRVDIAYETT